MHDPSFGTDLVHGSQVRLDEGDKSLSSFCIWHLALCEAAIVMVVKASIG